jgi:hypothetical protein
MSYDFRLYLPKEGKTHLEIATTEEEAIGITDPVPEKEARKKRVASSLAAINHSFKPFSFGFKEIAQFDGITIEEAKKKYRHIEMNGPEDGNGIQILLEDDRASITVPYFHKGEIARRIFKEIWRYLEIMQREGGYFIYDPQIMQIIKLEDGFDSSLACYQKVSGDSIIVKNLEQPTSSNNTEDIVGSVEFSVQYIVALTKKVPHIEDMDLFKRKVRCSFCNSTVEPINAYKESKGLVCPNCGKWWIRQ